MQHRYKTDLTAAEYVKAKGWQNATAPECIGQCSGPCGMQKHGTYSRKTPEGTRVRRWYCRPCHTTFSALPDCLASQSRGSLEEYERQVAAVEELQSISAAVRRLYPDCVNPESVRRRLQRRHKQLHLCLTIVRGLLLALAGASPSVLDFRLRLGTQAVLGEVREQCCGQLSQLPHPVGFRVRARRYGSQTGPPTLYVNQSESDSKQNCDFLAMVRFGPGEKSLEKPN